MPDGWALAVDRPARARGHGRSLPRGPVVRRPPAWLVAAILAALYLCRPAERGPRRADVPRRLFARRGLVMWDNGWYAGHHLPGLQHPVPAARRAARRRAWSGRSPRSPPRGAFERLLSAAARRRGARWAALWFAAGDGDDAGHRAADVRPRRGVRASPPLLALAARPPAPRARCSAALTALASPVAAAFLALGLAAWWLARATARAWWIAGGVAARRRAPALAPSPSPRAATFPFAPSAFWPALGGDAAAWLAVLPGGATRACASASCSTPLLLVAAFALADADGRQRRAPRRAVRRPARGARAAGRAAGAGSLLLVARCWSTGSGDARRRLAPRRGDPSVHAAYYRGAAGLARPAPAGARSASRSRSPTTTGRRAASRRRVPLARGWERQLDRKVNPLFYDGRPLTAGALSRLAATTTAVRCVALPDAPLDYSAAARGRAGRAPGSPTCSEVWRDAHWRLFAVTRPGAAGRRRGARHRARRRRVHRSPAAPGRRARARALDALLGARGRGAAASRARPATGPRVTPAGAATARLGALRARADLAHGPRRR